MSSAYKMLVLGENLTVSYAIFDTMLNLTKKAKLVANGH